MGQSLHTMIAPDSKAGTGVQVWLEKHMTRLFVAALGVYALVIWCFMGAWAGGADSSGYLNSARLLAAGRTTTAIRPIKGVTPDSPAVARTSLSTPLGFRPAKEEGTINPIYPIGLPLCVAAVAAVTNWAVAPGLTMGLHVLFGVILTYALGRESGLTRGWSALGALLLAMSPLYLFMGLELMSDVPALVWGTFGLLCTWRARERPGLAFVAGLVLGFSVLVRPTNGLLLLPALVAIGGNARRMLGFALGGLAPAIVMMRYNLSAYGGMFESGYFHRPDSFAWHRVDSTWIHYALWLPVLLTPLMVAAFFLPWARGLSRRWKIGLGLWVFVILGFYSCYLFTHMTWWFLRFLLPAFPPLIVAALHVLRSREERRTSRTLAPHLAWLAVAATVLVQQLVWAGPLRAFRIGEQEHAYQVTAGWLETHLPPDGAIWTMQNSGAIFYYTPFTVLRWDEVQPDEFLEIARRAMAAGTPMYAALQNFEKDDGAFPKHIPGHWEEIGHVRYTTVWKFVPP